MDVVESGVCGELLTVCDSPFTEDSSVSSSELCQHFEPGVVVFDIFASAPIFNRRGGFSAKFVLHCSVSYISSRDAAASILSAGSISHELVCAV